MKHQWFTLVALLALLTLTTACSDDENENVVSGGATMYTRAFEAGGDITSAQGSAKYSIDMNNSLLTLTVPVTLPNGGSISLTIGPATLSSTGNNVIYSFGSTASATGHTAVLNWSRMNLSTGAIAFQATLDGTTTVEATTVPVFYSTTTGVVYTSESGVTSLYSNPNVAYLLVPNATAGTCHLEMDAFKLSDSDVESDVLAYEGLTLTPTEDGYTITADSIVPTAARAGSYTLTDVNLMLTNHAQQLTGTFICQGRGVTVSGKAMTLVAE